MAVDDDETPGPTQPAAESESDESESESESDDTTSADVRMQVISLAEPEGQRTTAIEWSRRAKIATAELQGLIDRFEEHGWAIDNAERIYDDSLKILIQTLVLEERVTEEELTRHSISALLLKLRETGRVTRDEMVARCSEVQMMYLRAQFQQRCTTPPPAQPGASSPRAGTGTRIAVARAEARAGNAPIYLPDRRRMRSRRP